MNNKIKNLFLENLNEHIYLANELINDKKLHLNFEKLCTLALKTIKNKNKIILLGNGGSASDSQHIATELTVRFKKNRKAIAALAITTDTSALTAIGNDFSFDEIFSRQIEAIASKGDLVVPISTSGNSPNVLEAIKLCNRRKINIFSILGNNGGKAKKIAKNSIIIPHKSTARIQEFHIFIGHNLCDFLEKKLI